MIRHDPGLLHDRLLPWPQAPITLRKTLLLLVLYDRSEERDSMRMPHVCMLPVSLMLPAGNWYWTPQASLASSNCCSCIPDTSVQTLCQEHRRLQQSMGLLLICKDNGGCGALHLLLARGPYMFPHTFQAHDFHAAALPWPGAATSVIFRQTCTWET